MIFDEGLPFGGERIAESLRPKCAEALSIHGPDTDIGAPMRYFIALSNAITTGLQEGLGDPFIHEPVAIRKLEERCNEMDARSSISAGEWSDAQGAARAWGSGRNIGNPEFFASICISLERHTRDEEAVLHAGLISLGADEGSAADLARRTALAGFAITTTGDQRDWAKLLAKGNLSALRTLNDDDRDMARRLQAATLRRFMRITDTKSLIKANKETHILFAQISDRQVSAKNPSKSEGILTP